MSDIKIIVDENGVPESVMTKEEWYGSEIFDHEFCADGDACDNDCPFDN